MRIKFDIDKIPPLNLFNWHLNFMNKLKDTQEFLNPVHDFDVAIGSMSQVDWKEMENSAKKMLKEGTKFDNGKPRMDLLDANFLEGVAQVLTFGAQKYEAHNWRKGIAVSRLVAAAYRHLGAINRGEDIDPESGMPHAYHLGCCVMFLSEMLKRPEHDDRYRKGTS